ncbi:hypothetical protein BJ912DRAFT_932227 [Pholiota molesta]|nr:hypothetical protein BJ912DRAFT_932227 [Pholiota molesta]
MPRFYQVRRRPLFTSFFLPSQPALIDIDIAHQDSSYLGRYWDARHQSQGRPAFMAPNFFQKLVKVANNNRETARERVSSSSDTVVDTSGSAFQQQRNRSQSASAVSSPTTPTQSSISRQSTSQFSADSRVPSIITTLSNGTKSLGKKNKGQNRSRSLSRERVSLRKSIESIETFSTQPNVTIVPPSPLAYNADLSDSEDEDDKSSLNGTAESANTGTTTPAAAPPTTAKEPAAPEHHSPTTPTPATFPLAHHRQRGPARAAAPERRRDAARGAREHQRDARRARQQGQQAPVEALDDAQAHGPRVRDRRVRPRDGEPVALRCAARADRGPAAGAQPRVVEGLREGQAAVPVALARAEQRQPAEPREGAQRGPRQRGGPGEPALRRVAQVLARERGAALAQAVRSALGRAGSEQHAHASANGDGESVVRADYYSGLDLLDDGSSDEDESGSGSDIDGLMGEDDIPVTGFAVASNKRNADFHELFPTGDSRIKVNKLVYAPSEMFEARELGAKYDAEIVIGGI